MELFTKYDQFLEVREQLKQIALKHSVYSEDRDDERVRPLARITSESELIQINKLIAEWELLVDELCTEDPIRYKRNSTMFTPSPAILMNRSEVFIKVNTATSTRKLSKDNIIKRLTDMRRVEYLSNGKNAKVRQYDKEISAFKADEENTYRVRSDGYTEIVILHRAKGEADFTKARVPFIGTFVYDPKKVCSIHKPDQGREYERSDKITSLGIDIIPCSLNIRGMLFRETDIINAKARAKEAKLSAIEEKNRKAEEEKQRREKERQEKAELRANQSEAKRRKQDEARLKAVEADIARLEEEKERLSKRIPGTTSASIKGNTPDTAKKDGAKTGTKDKKDDK